MAEEVPRSSFATDDFDPRRTSLVSSTSEELDSEEPSQLLLGDSKAKLMRAVLITGQGEPEHALNYSDKIAIPEDPPENHVRVKVMACALNPVDAKLCHMTTNFPRIVGQDVSGVVESLGANVNGIHVNDEVFFTTDNRKPGGLAEYVVTKASTLSVKPKQMLHTDCAALPTAGYTALVATKKLGLTAGDAVLVTGGAGGVGSLAIQLCAMIGCSPIITTASTPDSASYVTKLGATHVINYTTEDVCERVHDIAPRGVKGVIDCVSSDSVISIIKCGLLCIDGGIAIIAESKLGPHIVEIDPLMALKQLSLHYIAPGPAAHVSEDLIAHRQLKHIGEELAGLYVSGKLSLQMLRSTIETTTLPQTPQHLQRIAARHNHGKIVVIIDEIGCRNERDKVLSQ